METTAFDGLFCFCWTKHTTIIFSPLHYYYILLCFWALGVIVPFYFRSLGSFTTRTHMDVANRLSGSYQFDIRINNVPVNKWGSHCERHHMWWHEWGCSEVDELIALPLKAYMLTCVNPCSCSHDAQQRPLDVLTLSLHVKELHHILMLAGIHEAFTKHFAKVPVWKNNMRHPLSIQFL